MLNQIVITMNVKFIDEELWVVMLSIYGFSQKNIDIVTKLGRSKIKQIVKVLCVRFNAENAGNMAFHAQKKGFNIDGTFDGEDIFSDEMKRKIIMIDDEVEFRYGVRQGM